jgi:hypothetical protein
MMDRSNPIVIEPCKDANVGGPNQKIVEEGKTYYIPYGIVRKMVISKVSRAELVDAEHAARLQYRLMLLAPVIKANVDFANSQITVIYNPNTADNNGEKISINGVMQALSKEGVHAGLLNIKDYGYDYYKEFYSYAYSPKAIKEDSPYGHSLEEWRKMKPKWEAKMKESNAAKMEKFRQWQAKYLAGNAAARQKIAEKK